MTLNRTRSLLCRDCAHPAIATHHFRNVDDSYGFFKTAAAGTAVFGRESTVKREPCRNNRSVPQQFGFPNCCVATRLDLAGFFQKDTL
jgi:hypothetical protein